MGGTGWRFALLLALTCLAPAAQAASLRAELRLDEAPRVSGEGGLHAAEGVLLLEEAVEARAAPRVSWSSALLVVSVTRGTLARGASESTHDGGEEVVETPLPAGSLLDLACFAGCRVVLEASGLGEVGVSGRAEGELHAVARSTPVWLGVGESGVAVAAWERLVDESAARGVFADPARVAHASGHLTLRLWNATARVRNESGGEWEAWAGRRESSLARTALVEVSRFETRHVEIRLADARLELPAGAPATLLAPGPSLALSGAFEAPRADGWAESGGRRVELRDARVRAAGEVEVRLATGPASAGAEAPLRAFAQGALEGEGTLTVDGARVGPPGGDAQRRAAAGAAAAVAALGLLALLKSGALGAFYTRVTRQRVLEHVLRRDLLALVQASPGAHVAELARRFGVGRVVLQHHLRMLEAHGLIVARPRGRVLVYFAPGAVPDEAGVAARVALKDPTRRRVLDAVARAAGGATQADICGQTSLSQRLVSYHLARLEAVGLVRGDGGRPQRFLAATDAAPRSAQA